MKTHLLKMKASQKILALEIRNLKSKRKELKGYVPGLGSAQYDYRANHIAYCLLRGRTLEQIEPKLRDLNDPTHKWVRESAAKIVASVLKGVANEQAVCTGG
jgi:hypothetical protein